MFKAIPLFSGSSGNCVYLQYNDEEILIDAGVSFKRICTALNSIGSDITRIKALLVTHEHSDHVKALEVLSKHTDIPIYINSSSARAFYCHADELFCGHAVIAEPNETLTFNGFEANIFATPHDSEGSVGYHFSFSDGERFALATDIGHLTDEITSYLLGCKEIVLESNHDIKMLNNGPYPYLLKKRISFSETLLEQTNMQVKEIAEKCGFSDSEYFRKCFKKVKGIPPGQWKKIKGVS